MRLVASHVFSSDNSVHDDSLMAERFSNDVVVHVGESAYLDAKGTNHFHALLGVRKSPHLSHFVGKADDILLTVREPIIPGCSLEGVHQNIPEGTIIADIFKLKLFPSAFNLCSRDTGDLVLFEKLLVPVHRAAFPVNDRTVDIKTDGLRK